VNKITKSTFLAIIALKLGRLLIISVFAPYGKMDVLHSDYVFPLLALLRPPTMSAITPLSG